jgi:hypothetical protein
VHRSRRRLQVADHDPVDNISRSGLHSASLLAAGVFALARARQGIATATEPVRR